MVPELHSQRPRGISNSLACHRFFTESTNDSFGRELSLSIYLEKGSEDRGGFTCWYSSKIGVWSFDVVLEELDPPPPDSVVCLVSSFGFCIIDDSSICTLSCANEKISVGRGEMASSLAVNWSFDGQSYAIGCCTGSISFDWSAPSKVSQSAISFSFPGMCCDTRKFLDRDNKSAVFLAMKFAAV
jgi:hypothetical protein